MENKILLGCSKEKLKLLADNSIDSIVTDPPYELGFMGKSWDNTGIAYDVELWKECLRVLKHGGHLLAFGGTRTYHRMAVAIEDAGFEVRDMIEWIYSTGFPKSLNIGKVADKFIKTGNASWNGTGDSSNGALGYSKLQNKQGYRPSDYSNKHQNTDEITEERAKQWEGWGTALKPSHEPICLARKPIEKGLSIAENCLKWGVGGMNIDESRVGLSDQDDSRLGGKGSWKTDKAAENIYEGGYEGKDISSSPLGRFPANMIHDGSEEVQSCFPTSSTTGKRSKESQEKDKKEGSSQVGWHKSRSESEYSDSGNASRFFKSILYYPKASKSERNKGCEELPLKEAPASARSKPAEGRENALGSPRANFHPTVKPVALMSYLITLITPKGGTVLDPFGGSGTTAVAAIENGFKYILIEKETEHIPIIEARVKAATKEETTAEDKQPINQLSLF